MTQKTESKLTSIVEDIDVDPTNSVDGIPMVEVGEFFDDAGDKYLLFVNRICNDINGNPATPQTFTVELEGNDAYIVEDVLVALTDHSHTLVPGLLNYYENHPHRDFDQHLQKLSVHLITSTHVADRDYAPAIERNESLGIH